MTADRIPGARPQVTVMFADISGYTAMSERLDPEAATDLINHCFAVLEAVVLACDGVVDKYIGDCIVGVWDLPDPAEAARQAARAACGIRAAVKEFNEIAHPPERLNVHVGLGSGPVLAGHIGGQTTGKFSVI